MAYNREPKREWPCEPHTLFKQANILFRWVFSLHREISSFLPWQISLVLALSIPQLAGHVLKCHSCCSKEQALQPHVPTSAQPLYIPALSRHHLQPREGTLNLFTPLCSFLYSFLCVLFIFSLFWGFFWFFLLWGYLSVPSSCRCTLTLAVFVPAIAWQSKLPIFSSSTICRMGTKTSSHSRRLAFTPPWLITPRVPF